MIEQKTILDLQLHALKYLGIKPEECLFFDIETTGLSWKTSYLYLLGIVCYENGHWKKILWFSQRPSEEKEILSNFSQLLYEKKFLIHYNGKTFDVPYLMHKYTFYQMNQSWDHLTQIDFYQKLLSYKKILKINGMKQKEMEQFIGIHRTDPYSGKELITMYKNYLVSGENDLQQALLLHNSEDIDGMIALLPLVCMLQIFQNDVSEYLLSPVIPEVTEQSLILTGRTKWSFPIKIDLQTDWYHINCRQNIFVITIPIYEGTLKYFFPDYKNYYYLKYEDEAIHKSIGSYVDKEYRENAKPNTCYKKVNGRFLPQFSSIFEPAFLENYKDSFSRFSFTNNFIDDENSINRYVTHLFQNITKLIH